MLPKKPTITLREEKKNPRKKRKLVKMLLKLKRIKWPRRKPKTRKSKRLQKRKLLSLKSQDGKLTKVIAIQTTSDQLTFKSNRTQIFKIILNYTILQNFFI